MRLENLSLFFKNNWKWLALFFIALLVINPIGEFALNDDWMYSMAVRNLLQGKGLLIPALASPTLVCHIAWGSICSLLLGASYSALRMSTLAMAFLALVWISLLAGARKNAQEPLALSPAFLLAGNPLFLLLSFTFMTDVPYLSWMLLALWLYSRAFETDAATDWLAASSAAALAYLTRQTALAVMAAVLLTMLLRRRADAKRLLLAFAVPVAAIAAYTLWFNFFHGGNWAAKIYLAHQSRAFIFDYRNYGEIALRFAAILFYAGFFASPLAFFLPVKREGRLGVLVAVGAVAALLVAVKGLPPYYCSIITPSGFGYLSLVGEKSGGFFGSGIFWLFAVALSVWAWIAFCRNWRGFAQGRAAFLVTAAFFHSLMSPVLLYLYDRYVLAVFAPFLAAVAIVARENGTFTRARAIAASSVGALFFIWALAGTWDYMNWNRARMDLTRAAVAYGIPDDGIDNGVEGYAGAIYERNMALLQSKLPPEKITPLDWININDFRAFIAYSRMDSPRWTLLAERSYFSPLICASGKLYLYVLPPGSHFHVTHY